MFRWIKRIDWFNRRALSEERYWANLNWTALLGYRDTADRYARALDTIIAQETPGANATVKRMARIAKEARGRV